MKNVTITLPEDTVRRARVVAASQGKSLSKFVSDLVSREVDYDADEILRRLSKYIDGPGIPGISKNWPTREEIYAEREDELLRRYERHRLHGRSERTGEAENSHELAEKDNQEPYVGPQSSEPE